MKDSSTYFSKEQRDEVLKCTFVLRADPQGNTGLIANQIWRDYVDNIPKYMSKILFSLFDLYVDLFSIDDSEIFEITQESVKMLASKFSDKFFMELFPHIGEVISKNSDKEHIVYSSFHIILLACKASSEKVLSGFKADILRYINENLHTEFAVVSKIFSSIIVELSYKFSDKNIHRNFVHNSMKNAKKMPVEEQTKLLKAVAYLVKISDPGMFRGVISEIFRQPYEKGFFNLFKMISSDFAKSLEFDTEVKEFYTSVVQLSKQLPEEAIECFVLVGSQIDTAYLRIFMEKFREMEQLLVNNDGQALKPHHLTTMLQEMLERTNYGFEDIYMHYLEASINMLRFNDAAVSKSINGTVKALLERINKIYVDDYADRFVKLIKENFDLVVSTAQSRSGFEEGAAEGAEQISQLMKGMVDCHIFVAQNVLLYGENKAACHGVIMNIIDNMTKKDLKPFIMKICGPIIRVFTEKGQISKNEGLLETIKQIIFKAKEDIKLISIQLQSVILKAIYDYNNEERVQLKCSEIVIRLQKYANKSDVMANDLVKNIRARIFEDSTACNVEVDTLTDLVRFMHLNMKAPSKKAIVVLVEDVLSKLHGINYEAWLNLLAVTKLIEAGTDFETEDKFLRIFTDVMAQFNGAGKVDMSFGRLILQESRENVAFIAKSIGKIVGKYKFYPEYPVEPEILKSYEGFLAQLIKSSDLLKASNNITDGNVCILLLSQGYVKEYDRDSKFRHKVINFVMKLIENNKVNSQLLFNCLQMIILKEINEDVDRQFLISGAEDLMIDEDTIEKIELFLKRIFY